MMPQLESIAITDFRSVRGTVTIPLRAPVILVHGGNGAGKTTIASAIELALTGELQTLERTDSQYRAHLLHRGAESGSVALSVPGLAAAHEAGGRITIGERGSKGIPLLDSTLRRFFSERCYLPQAALGRLLEIYQDPVGYQDSPLTQFVKDLLGIDHLDALIDGLQPARDLRNARKLVPEYASVEKARQEVTRALRAQTQSLSRIRGEVDEHWKSIRQSLTSLPDLVMDPSLLTQDLSALEAFLSDDPEEPQLVHFHSLQRELASIRQQFSKFSELPTAAGHASAEAELRLIRADLDAWSSRTGRRLEAAIGRLREVFPDLPSVSSTDPQIALQTALTRTERELRRCQTLIAQDDANLAKLEELGQLIQRTTDRIARADEQLGTLGKDVEGLGRAISELVPYVHDDACPLCGRDFREISVEPLAAFVAARASRLQQDAQVLQSLAQARSEASAELSMQLRDREALVSQCLAQTERAMLKGRVATLADSLRQLSAMADEATAGSDLLRRDTIARRSVSEFRARDASTLDARAALDAIARQLSEPECQLEESLPDAVKRLETALSAMQAKLTFRQQIRRRALAEWQVRRERQQELHTLEQAAEASEEAKRQLDMAYAVAERRRATAKALCQTAEETRTAIVARVFNKDLNSIWRELFVRLAPSEPYVPAFKLPRSRTEPVVAQLETVHRDGGRGGSPGVMLSSGNLNTAALTLFLALHLSIRPRLPWLILDDPVQSMDEVHVAQFAALLKTLSKQHGRQVMLTVHERPLFDYLALELSPAFDGDALVTIELDRSTEGSTVAEPHFYVWEPDRTVAA